MKYHTKKRQLLTDILASKRDETLTVEEIIELASEAGVSRSAVYRNLALLEEEGEIRRVAVAGSSSSAYRYTGATECREQIHLQCTQCGMTYHLASTSSSIVIARVLRDSDFAVDGGNTVLCGVCGVCRRSFFAPEVKCRLRG